MNANESHLATRSAGGGALAEPFTISTAANPFDPSREPARGGVAYPALARPAVACCTWTPRWPSPRSTSMTPMIVSSVAFTLPASPWLRNEWGTGFTALDVKINFLRAVPADGRDLLATGMVLHRGKRLAVATAEVMHGNDRVAVLTGTTALTPRASLRSTHRRDATGSTQAAAAA
jgi:Thioesterase superfamily